MVRYGQGQLGALEDRLGALEEHVARIGRENLQELSQLGERIRWARASCCLLPAPAAACCRASLRGRRSRCGHLVLPLAGLC